MAIALKVLVGILAATSATLLYFLIHEFNPFLRRCNPDVCQSYALSAFKAHRVMHQGAGHCEYGLLPGFLTFNVMQPPGSRWQTAVSSCQLQNRLTPGAAATGDVRILLLGDSVDAHLAKEWCTLLQQPLRFTHTGMKGAVAGFAARMAAKATGSSSSSGGGVTDPDDCCKDRDVLYYCTPESAAPANGNAASISIGMFHLLGVHLDGPYHTGAKGNFLTRIPLALQAFNATMQGGPDMVILHSNFWDQSRMWEQHQPGYGALNKLMPDVVFSWSSNFSLLMSTTAEHLPGSLLAVRTAAFPAFTANWLGRWQYIHQLNMAAIEVTRLHGHAVIDLGGMVFGLEPRQYLDDQHHPNKIVLLECANIAMNLLYQQQHREEALRGQGQEMLSSEGSTTASRSSSSVGDRQIANDPSSDRNISTSHTDTDSKQTAAQSDSNSTAAASSSSSSSSSSQANAQPGQRPADAVPAEKATKQPAKQQETVLTDVESRQQQQEKDKEKQPAAAAAAGQHGVLRSPAVTVQAGAREQQQVDGKNQTAG